MSDGRRRLINIRAIILAAGTNNRFEASYPKCFAEVSGRTIIDRLIDQFHHAGVRDIYVVTRAGLPWHEGWWVELGLRPVSILMVGDTKCPFDSFRDATKKISLGSSTVVVSGDCIIDSRIIEKLVTNHFGIMVVKYPSSKTIENDDNVLGLSIPGGDFSSFMIACWSVSEGMRFQEFLGNRVSDFFISFPHFAEKPWIGINVLDDVKEAEKWLKAKER